MTDFEKHFSQGYACAVANLIRMYDQPTIAQEVFSANFCSIKEMRKMGIDESDIEVLKPIVKEIERKRTK